MDIPLDISLARLQDKLEKDVYENKEKLTKVKENYQNILQEYQGLKLSLDATEKTEIIHQKIVQFIETKFN